MAAGGDDARHVRGRPRWMRRASRCVAATFLGMGAWAYPCPRRFYEAVA